MSDYTAEEIEAAIEALTDVDESSEWYGESLWGEIGYHGGPATLPLRGAEIPLEHVARAGGMDEGSDIWTVFRLGDQLFKKSGYYASHYGSDWDGDLREVHVVERMVTCYE